MLKITLLSSTYVYGSEFSPKLGKGVNASETKTYASCVLGIETDTVTESAALVRHYNETRINNREDLHKAFEINASVSAKGLWGSAGGGMNYFSNVSISSESFYWLVDAKYNRSTSFIKTVAPGFGLTNNAKVLLKNHGIEKFYEACGTHFYSGQTIGARYSLLYEFKSTGDNSLTKLSASAGGGGFGISAKTEFKSFVEQAASNTSLTVHSSIIGGDDRIKDYAKNPEQLETELAHLRENLYHGQKGVVLAWSKDSYDEFPEVQDAKKDKKGTEMVDTFRSDALGKYYNLYTLNKTKVLELESLIKKSSGPEPLYVYSAQKMRDLREGIRAIGKQNELVERRAKECISSDGKDICKFDGLEEFDIELPKPDRDLSHFGDWDIVPLLRADSDNTHPNFDLIGTPEGNCSVRVFDMRQKLFTDTANSAHVLGKHWDGIRGQIKLGSLNTLIDPKTGRHRPGLCMGGFEDICTIRVVENPEVRFPDGCSSVKMQLSIFNEQGFLYRKFDFFARK